MIQLGNKARDKVTGFEGIVTARVIYLNGCIQLCVKPAAVDGKMPEGEYIDIDQLEFVGDGVRAVAEPVGGPMPDTPSTRYEGD